jgi:methionyl-tRNA synthetase
MADKPTIPFDDFIKLDLRVATITAAEAHPNADKLLKIQLDDGTPDGRQVCAGIREWYDPASLVGRHVVIVAKSQGMILAATDVKATDDEGQATERDVIVLTVDKPVKAGSAVS